MFKMKLRLAKKLLLNCPINWYYKLMRLYPPYKKNGRTIYPSWHNNPQISAARTRIRHWIKKKH